MVCVSLLLATGASAQNVGVGTNAPAASAILEVEGQTGGILIPRVTSAQMTAITSPMTGLLVFNTTATNFFYFDGTFWVPIVGQGWSLTGDAGTNPATNFLGTTDATDVVQKTNYRERMRVYAATDVGLTSQDNRAEQLYFNTPTSNAYTAFLAGAQSTDIMYRLPLDGGSSNAALITDGNGYLSWKVYATIGGGGSVTLWERGSGQNTLEGDGYGNHSSGQFGMTEGINCQSSGQEAMVWGSNNQGSGQHASLVGGESNQGSGNDCTIHGGTSNQSSGDHSAIFGGSSNQSSGSYSVVMGGQSNHASGSTTTIINGHNNAVSGGTNLLFGTSINLSGNDKVIFRASTTAPTYFGIGTTAPSEALHVVGNVRFSAALKPNGSGGSSSNYLRSAGASSSPTWGTITVPTNNWNLTGNAGTSPATNFIGTTDATGFTIRTNGTPRVTISSAGLVGIGTTAPTHQLEVESSSTADEIAAANGTASGASTNQSIGIWADANTTSASNTGTIALLATGNKNLVTATTNAAVQINDGEFAMGRGTTAPSAGTVVEPASTGTAYSQVGPSGIIDLAFASNLTSVAPTTGLYQAIGTVTINNRYATAASIIELTVVSKINGGGAPDPANAIYKADVNTRAAGSFQCTIGMIPTTTSSTNFQGSDHIRLAYVILNPGK